MEMKKALNKSKGSLIVFSGPSGVGKDTILKKLCEKNKNIKVSISATTRPKREYEKDGKDYYFLTKHQFLDLVNNNQMLEFADYCNNYYGTPLQPVENFLNMGFDVILEIETEGAFKIINNYPDVVSIFVLPKSLEVLKDRLLGRASDNKESILKRLSKAKSEIQKANRYQYVVINDNLSNCIEEINSIIKAESLKFIRNKNIINEVLKYDKTFNR